MQMTPSLEILRVQHDYIDGTFGMLRINKVAFCWTLERAYLENRQYVSSIPPQQYKCKRVISSKFGETFQVENVSGRTKIRLHSANTMDQLEGCIAVGDRLGFRNGKQAVLNSRKTFARFMKEMEGFDECTLTINEVY